MSLGADNELHELKEAADCQLHEHADRILVHRDEADSVIAMWSRGLHRAIVGPTISAAPCAKATPSAQNPPIPADVFLETKAWDTVVLNPKTDNTAFSLRR